MQLIMPYLAGCFLAKTVSFVTAKRNGFAHLGGQGEFPPASQFLQVSTWKKLVEMVPMS
jgi:hypothetical protein